MTMLLSKKKCKICSDSRLRLLVVEMSETLSPAQINKQLKEKHNVVCASGVIDRHLKEHEKLPQLWSGVVKMKYNSQQEREKFEQAFLSRISFATELYDKYMMLSSLLDVIIGDVENPNTFAKSSRGVEKVTMLAKEMHEYLKSLMGLQTQRTFATEFAKVLLFSLGEGLIERLRFVMNDLPVERRELVGRIIREEIKKGLDYSKSFNKEKASDLINKAQIAYDELVQRVDERTL